MKKPEIAEKVALSTEYSKSKANELVDVIIEEITNALNRGEDVSLPGFGSFKVSHRQQRTGRNPKTGASIVIPAQNGVNFRPGKSLKDSVNNT